MTEKIWKLRSKARGVPGVGERTYTNEAGFIAGLQDAWRAFGSDISATLPTGEVLTDAALKDRYPAP